MGNGITVPKEYKHMLRSEATPEYKRAQIRDYVNAHPNEVIKVADFEAIVGTTAAEYVRRMIREGNLTRQKITDGTRGVKYTYKWHDISTRVQEGTHGDVIVKSLGFEPWPLGQEHGHKLMAHQMDAYIEEFIDDMAAEQIKGMLLFKKHINRRYREVEKQRKHILEGGRNEDEPHTD